MPDGYCDRCHDKGVPIGLSQYTDGIFFWQCVNCDNRWHAHAEGTKLRELAEPYVNRGRKRAG